MLSVSRTASNTSVGANLSIRKPSTDAAQGQEVSRSSESDTQHAKKENVNLMIEMTGTVKERIPEHTGGDEPSAHQEDSRGATP